MTDAGNAPVRLLHRLGDGLDLPDLHILVVRALDGPHMLAFLGGEDWDVKILDGLYQVPHVRIL